MSEFESKLCPCGGTTQLINGDYTIRTRIPGKQEIILNNIKHNRCKICGYTSLTDSSKLLVESVRKHYVKSYYSQDAAVKEVQVSASSSTPFKTFLKSFRS